MKKSDKQTSEDFDDFLTGEGMLDEVRDGAMKKVDAYRKKAERQISLNMAKNSLVLTPPPAVSDADRRSFLRIAALGGAGLAAFGLPDVALADDAVKAREMVRMQEKTDLILLTDRPPQLETPLHYFRSDLTPNDAFFVRWHLSGLRTTINPKRHTLNISGHVNTPLKVSLKQLRDDFEAVSVVAVNQCSGNSRGVFEPHVPGSQWGNGAMGNARWTGVRLKDVLAKVGVKAGAVEVSFQGLDVAPLPATPPYIKALQFDRANDGDVMIAYEMNGADLPMLNGYPLRLIVPGWYSTYWMKSLSDITVLDQPFKGFWMDKAYRIPDNKTANETADHLSEKTVPINRMCVRSLFVFPETNAHVTANQPLDLEGVAFDGGSGIKAVEVSADGGTKWEKAELKPSLGNYSWCRWSYRFTPTQKGNVRLLTRAVANSGETQNEVHWNRSGYQRGVIEHFDAIVD